MCCIGLWVVPCRKWTWGVAVPHLTGLRGCSIVKGGSSLFSFTTLTLRVSFQFAAGFPVSPHLFSLGKYSCLPAPAYLVCSVVLLPAVLSCIFLAKYLGYAMKRKVIRKAAPGDETGTSGEQGWQGVAVIRVGLCKEQSYTLMSESSTTAEQGSDPKPPQMQRERVPQGMQELQLNLCFILGARCVIG